MIGQRLGRGSAESAATPCAQHALSLINPLYADVGLYFLFGVQRAVVSFFRIKIRKNELRHIGADFGQI
jgi:hypothetical protein